MFFKDERYCKKFVCWWEWVSISIRERARAELGEKGELKERDMSGVRGRVWDLGTSST